MRCFDHIFEAAEQGQYWFQDVIDLSDLPRLEHAILHLISVDSPGVYSLLMAGFDGLCPAPCGSSIRLELGLDASVHCTEQKGRPIYRLANS